MSLLAAKILMWAVLGIPGTSCTLPEPWEMEEVVSCSSVVELRQTLQVGSSTLTGGEEVEAD